MFPFSIQLAETIPSENAPFLQTPFWAKFKNAHGWKSYFFEVSLNADVNNNANDKNFFKQKFFCSVLVRDFKKIFSLAYVPHFDFLENANEISDDAHIENVGKFAEFFSSFSKAIKKFLPKNVLFIRYDALIEFADFADRDFFNSSLETFSFAQKLKIKKAKADVQVPDTVLLDLKKSLDELLSEMKSKWRYNIRLSEKKGVTVKKYDANDEQFTNALETFYALYRTTAKRDGIALHEKKYYEDLCKLSVSKKEAPNVSIFVAEYENIPLAAIIVLFSKREAVYLYGASSNEKRNFMPTYLLQWRAIEEAKKNKCEVYDFYGIPPFADDNHPMHGLYLFKTGFGGKKIHRVGSLDVWFSPLYHFFSIAEKLRLFYYKKIKKTIRGR